MFDDVIKIVIDRKLFSKIIVLACSVSEKRQTRDRYVPKTKLVYLDSFYVFRQSEYLEIMVIKY